MLHGYCNAVKIAGTRSYYCAARPQRSPICTMRCGACDVTLLLEDLATIMSRARTENSLRVVAGGQGGKPETTSGGKLPLETTSFVGRGRRDQDPRACRRLDAQTLNNAPVGDAQKTRKKGRGPKPRPFSLPVYSVCATKPSACCRSARSGSGGSCGPSRSS